MKPTKFGLLVPPHTRFVLNFPVFLDNDEADV